MNKTNAIALLLLIVAIFVFAPWIAFWAINVLFAYSIPYTLKTWFAYWVLMLFVFGSGKVSTNG
jgi:hypothetical protein